MLTPAWAEVCPSLPTGQRRGRSGRVTRWRTSPPVSRLQALSAVREWRRPPRQRTRARGTSRPPRASRAGSHSNPRVRSRTRTAGSRYQPRSRVTRAGTIPAATVKRRRTAPGITPLSVCVPTVLPREAFACDWIVPSFRAIATNPLLPMILPRPLPTCSESNREAVFGNLQSDAVHTASYTAWVFRSTSSRSFSQIRQTTPRAEGQIGK